MLDDSSKIALIEFSYNLTLGKLEEAYRAVKTIESPSIWENMAGMCVKTKRLDVAEVPTHTPGILILCDRHTSLIPPAY